MQLKDKIVLVTGGSSGIGEAIAEKMYDSGCKVVVTYNTHIVKNKNIDAIKADLRQESEIRKVFEFIESHYGKLDILVNNAGINTRGEFSDIKIWRDVFEVDVFGTVQCTAQAALLMKEGGKIINISSIYADGHVSWTGMSAYSAAKAAINNFTQVMAKSLAPNILVNAISPGYVKTPLWGVRSQEEFSKNGKEQLIERMIDPEEIASMALELARNDAITGEIIVVDGGLSLKSI